jgi:molybdopterin-containing oxidoreductase family membrane subunit
MSNGVFFFGDANEDTVTNGAETFRFSELIRDKAGYRLMEDLGTKPSVYYLPPVNRNFHLNQVWRKVKQKENHIENSFCKMNQLSTFSAEKIASDLYPKKFGRIGRIWTLALVVICCIGIYAYYRQLSKGLVVTNLRDYVSWGIYISNFVFFVAISLVGSLITAVLRLSDVKWSTPLTRIAEIIAVSAIVCASIIILVDMGRPERFLNLFLHIRIQSPIIWDVVVISTYFVISLLLLYLPMLPDLQILNNNKSKNSGFQNWLYKFLGSFWKGTKEQFSIANRSVLILCITIIPVAFMIHTVTSWLFATTYRPGWDSTNFGAYLFRVHSLLVEEQCWLLCIYLESSTSWKIILQRNIST